MFLLTNIIFEFLKEFFMKGIIILLYELRDLHFKIPEGRSLYFIGQTQDNRDSTRVKIGK